MATENESNDDKKDKNSVPKEEPKKPRLPPVAFRELFRYSTTLDNVLIFFGFFASCGAGCTQPLLMVLFGDLTAATAATTDDVSAIVNPLAIKMMYVAAGAMVLYFIAYFMIPWTAARQIKRIREEYYKALLRQDMEFFDNKAPGVLSAEFSDTIHTVYKGMAQKIVELCDAGCQCLFGVFIAFFFSWKLALACLLGIPLLGLSGAALVTSAGSDGVYGKEAYNTASGIANEALSAIRTVASFGGEVAIADRYESHLGVAREAAIKGGTKAGSAMGFLMATFTAMYAVGFGVGGELVRLDRLNYIADYPAPTNLFDTNDAEWMMHAFTIEALCVDADGNPLPNTLDNPALAICACDLPWFDMNFTIAPQCGCGYGRTQDSSGAIISNPNGCEDVGSILTAFFTFIIGGFALGQVGPALKAIAEARAAAAEIFEVIDLTPKIDVNAPGEQKFEGPVRGEIEFKNVHFAYKKMGEDSVKPVFAGLNLHIKPGETVALVGESGSGKSTVGRLLGRMYDPSQGSVFVDGIDITKLAVNDLRINIGLVSQEPLLFDQSIRENIALGLPGGATLEKVQAAAKAANAHGFITSGQFPEQYETSVGARGSKLSGGQKQRVAIARAILRNPPIMILDEATSALDTKSERIVQKALDDLMDSENKRTTLVIAHRLTTVRRADRIVVLGEDPEHPGEGTVIREEGTHDELMAKEDGLYKALVGGQAAAASATEDIVSVVSETKEVKATDTSTKSDVKDEDDDKAKKKEADVSNDRVWAYAKGNYHLIGLGLFSAVLNGCIQPGIAIAFSEILSTFANYDTADMQSQLIMWCMFFLGLAFGQAIFHYGQVVFMTIVGERITSRIRGASFRAMLRQDISWFDEPENNVGALTSQLGMDAAYVQVTTGATLGGLVNTLACVSLGFIIAFTASWKITLVILGGVPFIGVANMMMMQILAGGEAGVQDLLTQSVGTVSESVSGMREVQAFALQAKLGSIMSDMLGEPLRIQKGMAFKGGLSFAFVQASFFSFYALAFWWGGQVITKDDNVTFNDFMKSLFGLAFSAMGAGTGAAFCGDHSKAIPARNRLFRLIDRVPAIDTQPWNNEDIFDVKERKLSNDHTIPESEFEGHIELTNVDFAYPTRKDAKVFNKTSISIPSGSTVALVGTSGSGKSTTIQLLERFYDPLVERTEGKVEVVTSKPTKHATLPDNSVCIDGYDIRTLDLKWLRQHIGLVGQEPVLFFGTVFDNIAAGKEGATQEEVEAAAKAANAHGFIMEDPDGYQRNVGERGSLLSGGQKQRVAIARAIIKNPKILLLDEATSALDNDSEKIVQASLDALISKTDVTRTTVVIAHRLSTIKNADIIYVLDNDGTGARVVEQGSHVELLKRNGVYKNLYRAYASAEELAQFDYLEEKSPAEPSESKKPESKEPESKKPESQAPESEAPEPPKVQSVSIPGALE